MTEINSINIAAMPNAPHLEYANAVLTKAAAHEKLKTAAAEPLAAFEAAVKAEDEALKLSQKSMTTDEITAADTARDKLYMAFKKTVVNSLDLPIETMAAAAKVLNQLVKDYDIDPAEQIDSETSKIDNFVRDAEEKYKEQVAALSLTAILAELKAKNELVRTLNASRTEEKAARTVGALRKCRAATDEAYRLIVKWINALALTVSEEDYSELIDYVNELIKHYKQEVLATTKKTTTTEE